MLNEAGRYRDAIDRARSAVSIAPSDPRPYLAWAFALFGAGKYEESAAIAERVTKLAPNNSMGFCLQSRAIAASARSTPKSNQKKMGREAVALAREAVRLAPQGFAAHLALAQALPLTGDLVGADEEVRELIRIAPNSVATWVAASLVAIRAQDWNAAIEASRKALAIDPNDHAALNNLGVALQASGQKSEGTRALAQAARANPDSQTARRNLSRTGLNYVRVAVLIVLIPVGLIAHVGFTLYWIAAISSQLLLRKYPQVFLKAERWAAPIALYFARFRHREVPQSQYGGSLQGTPETGTFGDSTEWSSIRGRHKLRSSVLVLIAVSGWIGAACFILIFALATGPTKYVALTTAVVLALLSAKPMMVVRKRQGRR
jgi:tetratricopeptide (TPR) repeat protein